MQSTSWANRALATSRPSGSVVIGLLGAYAFECDGQAVAPQTWQRSHARKLIQLLCSAPRCSELRDTVLTSLWPDSENERARNRLHHTVHFIRKAWEQVPLSARPQLTVGTDRVTLVPAENTLIDVQAFVELAESDLCDGHAQLDRLERALALYGGPLAADWDGCEVIATRRAWLANLRESVLREAVATATEIGLADRALHHAHQLALLLQSDCRAHCQYALLLADYDRADAALLHCHAARPLIAAEDAGALAELELTVQHIQQRANRGGEQRAHAAAAPVLVDTPLPVAAATFSAARAPAPNGPLLGYDHVMQLCVQNIQDPFSVLTTVVGPPGAGKSLLAATVAQRLQSSFRHGVLWLDASLLHNQQALLLALRGALAQAFAPAATRVEQTQVNPAAAVADMLRGKELLLVLDGLPALDGQLGLGDVVKLAGHDARWLATSWSACHLRGERLVRMEPSFLLQTPAANGSSAAALILQRSCAGAAHTQGPRALQAMERIATALDGVPQLLELAGAWLTSMSPNELQARLNRDPSALLRQPVDGVDPRATYLAQRVVAWLEPATVQMRGMLSLLGRCQSWLVREDIEALLDRPGLALVDALIEQAVRHQWLLRRVSGTQQVSEFRVPRIVTAALRLQGDADELVCSRSRIESWLQQGHMATHAADTHHPGAASLWFDAHIADLDTAIVSSIEAGRLQSAALICKAHAPHWSLQRHAERVKTWLEALGDTMQSLDGPTAAPLLVARARLRAHLGDTHRACDDANRALACIDRDREAELSRHALHLLQHYGVNQAASTMAPTPLLHRGVEAGETLLRVAQLALRSGQLCQALPLCVQARQVFEYFGLANGVVRAHQLRAKTAYALGDTELATRCLTEAERAAQRHGDLREVQRAQLMKADVLLSQMQFSQAIELASAQMSRNDTAEDPALLARGMGTVAWAYYGQGAYRLAQALCAQLREQVQHSRNPALLLNTSILSALIEARCQRPAQALQNACSALELLMTSAPCPETQGDLINGAELAVGLGRPDLAGPLLRSLQAFSSKPEHRLRDWIGARAASLAAVQAQCNQDEDTELPLRSQFDVLSTLTTVRGAM
jgi:DNA-binding SARP family transcriptional activator